MHRLSYLPATYLTWQVFCNVVREFLALSKQCVASRSSRLALSFVLGDLVFLSSKVYIFTCVTDVLVHFPLFIKLACHCTRLNIIVNVTFFLVAIVICFLRHPLIIMINYNLLHLLCHGGHLAHSPWAISSMLYTFCCLWRSSVKAIGTNTCSWSYICISLIKFFVPIFFQTMSMLTFDLDIFE